MSDEKKYDYGILSSYGGKFYHRPEWKAYAAKVEQERALHLKNAKIVLKEKHIQAGGALYTFTAIRGKNGKPYIKITGEIKKVNYKGSIVIQAPYLLVFVAVMDSVIQFSRSVPDHVWHHRE